MQAIKYYVREARYWLSQRRDVIVPALAVVACIVAFDYALAFVARVIWG